MKPELVEHLNKAREAMTDLDSILSRNKYRDDLRSALVAGLLTTIIQYHHSILLLANHGDIRSAVALARDVVDNMYVGLWINVCASSDQISKIKGDASFPVTYPEIFEQVDSRYKDNTLFADLRNRCGAPLYSYNRSGILTLGLWSVGSSVELEHDELELARAASGISVCILFLASEFLANQNQPAESTAVRTLIDDYEKRCASLALFLHKSA